MDSKLKWLFATIIAFVLGASAGGYLVHRGTTQILMDSAIDIDAHSLSVYASALQSIRTGDLEAATERLETWMDMTLVRVMEPSNYDVNIRDITVARADSAFFATRAYREAYPLVSGVAAEPMVAAVWRAGPPSGFR